MCRITLGIIFLDIDTEPRQYWNIQVLYLVSCMYLSPQAPASFGLVTYLLHEGLDRARVRKHLLVFCLAAPSAAIATFLLLLSRSVLFSQSQTQIKKVQLGLGLTLKSHGPPTPLVTFNHENSD